jgi:hypothetical protein
MTDDLTEICVNCKRVYHWRVGESSQISGWGWLCPECTNAYWSGDDNLLEDRRCHRAETVGNS